MNTEASIETIDGKQYRFTRSRGKWRASFRCDCLLGPHWHGRDERAGTKKELRSMLGRASDTTEGA